MKKLKAWGLILALLMATSCCPAGTIAKRMRLPDIKERKVEVKCCLLRTSASTFLFLDEDVAVQMYSAANRYYYMDGESWANLLKVSAERAGRIHEYEQFPCVDK